MELTSDVLGKIGQLPTGNIADNNSIQGTMDEDIKPLHPSMHLTGTAVTVECFPGDNLAFYQGIEAAHAGDVIVFASHGYTKAGHFGDMMATACKRKGIAGVVIDGACRDKNDICELGFPVFARTTCPAGTVKESLGKINCDVTVGNVTVHPGDLIVGDCDGVIVVRQQDINQVIMKACNKFDHENEIRKRLEAGESILSVYGFDTLIEKKKAGN